ncbi:tail protein [Xenorhabdus vietnamensis]|uniref:Tail protein n=1 Tax=Xenorhabdus vietnamensis TaxID=351656 RepID=A0A1Y2SFQ5_9GAMM|nr:phage tail protein [Xenorhabdus vietnamensis]OTA16409.1 tail protein [Xenorhabdus vietnamensis]
MSTKYFALLTHAGTEKLEKAASSGTKLEITHMAVGDGGGSLPTPNASQSALINEKHRAELDALTIAPQKPGQIIAEQVIPEGNGNWWVREMGLFDKDGTLIAVGNCADLYKSESQEQAISMALKVDDNGQAAEWIKEFISGLATRRYVREKIKEHAESRDHPDATLKERGFVALSNAINSDSEAHAATPKAIKTAYELANKAYELATSISSTEKYVPLTRKVNGKELSKDIELVAVDVNAYDKSQTDSLVDEVKTLANKALDLANTKVPLTRKVNGKELVIDVELTALDVDAYSRKETDGLIAPVEASAKTANQNAITALKEAESKVPLTRKINNKELITDIQLTAADIDTYNKTEIDDHIGKVDKLAETANHNATTAIQDANNKVPLTRKVNGKELTTDIQLTATDVDTYNKAEIDDRIGKVDKLAETANHNATTAIQDANNKVPLARKINGKELISDIELRAVDVGAYGKEETDSIIKDVRTQIDNVNNLAETANTNAIKAIRDADGKVPLTRKINNKELTSDILLTAADIDTYSKVEVDERISKVDNRAETAIQDANSKVPLTRKINNKELTTDIQLTAADIDTYSKAEVNERIDGVQKLADTAIQDANSKVPLTRKINNKELTTDIQLTAADIDTYNKVEVDNRIDSVQKLAENAIQDANSKVPLTRKVNGKELITDIVLAASDVDSYNKKESDDLISGVKAQVDNVQQLANTANTNAIKAIQDAEGKVPVNRKVNGKELTTDILLTAADIGTYNKVEVDDSINSVQKLAENAIQDANSKVPLTRKVNGKELITDIILAASDVDSYNKKETDELISGVKTQVDNVQQLANTANTNAIKAIHDADGKVPLTRKVNGKELTTDILLTAADIDTYSKVEVDERISKVDNRAETAIQDANSKVPLTRKINNKELTTDIQLTAADIDTYSKVEVNERIDGVQKLANTAIQDANSKVPLTRKINNKELTTDIQLTAADIDTYSKVEVDNRIDSVQKLAENAIQDANSKVPLTRKVNGKELITDIVLAASDVDSYNKKESDDLISSVKAQVDNVQQLANTANTNAIKAIHDAEGKVPLTRKVNGKELSADIQLTTADINAYNKEETDAHIKDVKAIADAANQKANDALQSADKKVPLTRKVNGKELLTDIDLNAADIGTYNKAEIDDRVSKVDKLAETANNNATTAIQDANSKVPLTRKVNGKELSVDIQLIAADVDTYNKSEINDHIGKVDKLAETANNNAITAIQNADSRVPSTRKVNGRELATDITLNANDVDTYDRAHIDIIIGEVRDQANAANNNADSKVPLTRTINGKALLSDVKLTASDLNTYTKGEVDRHLESLNDLANVANNNADNRVPLTRTVNGKALLTDIRLTASDVGAYSKVEVDTRVGKAEKLASDANVNAIAAKADAESRLEKSKNGADIPDKQAFVRNLGLGELVGLSLESRRVGEDHTIIKLGDIFMLNGLAVASEPIGEFNQSVIGGVAYYTHYYKIKLPTALPNGIISCQASIVGDNFDNQHPGYLADVKTRRDNSNGIGLSKDTLTVSVTTPQLGWTPHFYYQVVGY